MRALAVLLTAAPLLILVAAAVGGAMTLAETSVPATLIDKRCGLGYGATSTLQVGPAVAGLGRARLITSVANDACNALDASRHDVHLRLGTETVWFTDPASGGCVWSSATGYDC